VIALPPLISFESPTSVRLDRDGVRSKIIPEEQDKRRSLFWNLVRADARLASLFRLSRYCTYTILLTPNHFAVSCPASATLVEHATRRRQATHRGGCDGVLVVSRMSSRPCVISSIYPCRRLVAERVPRPVHHPRRRRSDVCRARSLRRHPPIGQAGKELQHPARASDGRGASALAAALSHAASPRCVQPTFQSVFSSHLFSGAVGLIYWSPNQQPSCIYIEATSPWLLRQTKNSPCSMRMRLRCLPCILARAASSRLSPLSTSGNPS
jgi:hypothetical protein